LGCLRLSSFLSSFAAFAVPFLVVAGGEFAPFAGKGGREGRKEEDGEYVCVI